MATMTTDQALRWAMQHHSAGRLAEAKSIYERVLSAAPNHADALHLLGVVAAQSGHHQIGIDLIRRAIAVRPDQPDYHSDLGKGCRERGQLDEAVLSFQRAIAIDPNSAPTHNHLGNAWKDKGQLDAALACYRRAVALSLRWPGAHDNLVFTLQYVWSSDLQSVFEEASQWNRQHVKPLGQVRRPHVNGREAGRRLRVGYVSPDFRNHPVGRLMVPLLASHDHERFEVFCYAIGARADAVTEKLRVHADQWRSLVGIPDDAAAELIRQDKIDILVDLAMHTAGNRIMIFARKPAPVQVTYLGSAGGTGVDAIDYRLTDRHIDPDESNDRFYLEKSFRLNGAYSCYQPDSQLPEVNPLPAVAGGHVTFGCLNNFSKVTPQTLAVWADVLRAVPESRLLLLCPVGSHRDALKQFFIDHGIAAERLELVGHLSEEDYFRTYLRIDIALDPFPYAGGMTTLETLWMGVPLVTLAGRTAVGRVGVSTLTTLGHPEWIADTSDEYTRIAADLAADLPRLSEVRRTLREQMQASPLMDAAGFARGVEAAYRAMWETWCTQV